MEPLIVLAATFVLLWVLFILPQQRRVRAHQALVASLEPGDEVVLSAGIHGRIADLGPEELMLEVAPGVELRVARQAVLRLVEHATRADDDSDGAADDSDSAADDSDSADGAEDASAGPAPERAPDDGAVAPSAPDPDDRGPTAPGPNV
ncbi:MAG TPA: preprotein translocase subunit YajC [Acidimicrobiales bacterium]|jgi:preprotein translocase subunit YajC|nr:preprotein translocase subunit YajC [Acidimicrobiales bacterium]